jgi:hypothetical protein
MGIIRSCRYSVRRPLGEADGSADPAQPARRPRSNPSNAGAVCNPGQGRLGAALKDHRSLLPGDVAGRHQGLPRLFLMVAAKRKEAFGPKAIDFREVEANPGSSIAAIARSR